MSAQRMPNDAGAALVTVLVFLAVMSALAIVVVDAARFSTRRTANQAALTQARWYALGAESYAERRIDDLKRRNEPIDQSEWQGRPLTYPLDRGTMTLTLWDGSNCFNLNSLAEMGEGGTYEASARGMVLFARLLDQVSVHAPGLPLALADWLDADATTRGGSEEVVYGMQGGGYGSGGVLMADMAELQRVHGFSDELIARLAPLACVRSVSGWPPLNVNTLTADQAVLLTVLFGEDALSLGEARALIRMRPQGGWRDADEFWRMPQLAGVEASDSMRAQIALDTRYYVLSVRVAVDDMVETDVALIDAAQSARVVRRVFGAAGERPML